MALSVNGWVSTPEIDDLDTVDLEDPGTYRIVRCNPGGIVWVREEATSRWTHGRVLTNARKDIATLELAVRVYGSTASLLNERLTTLLRCFEQFRYRVEITLDTVEYRWWCQPADYALEGGDFDKFALQASPHQQVVVFAVPRDPIPDAGGL